mgnify:FL=1
MTCHYDICYDVIIMDMQTEKFTQIARREVLGALREIFSDSDFGLPLRTIATRRLRKSIQLKKEGRTKNLKEVLTKLARS